MSRKPFAVNLSTFRDASLKESNWAVGTRYLVSAWIDAVWYRRKDGETRACLGTLHLWSHSLREPVDVTDPIAVLSADLDGRYGGDCMGRWDGTRYWGAQEPAVMEQHLAVLQPMLANYPACPDGYSHWWRF